jgi:aerotaxis receptor
MDRRERPNGRFRVVGIDDLFFSTTDRKGVITGANSVFQRLSAFDQGELMGAPHNLIRHPGMPGGAFRLMWDTILARRPFAAYVRNLAKDGYTYWVFATITPLGDGFLSVRATPCADKLWQTASDLYEASAALEDAARRAGQSRAESAAVGLGHLSRLLAKAGFASYDDFMFAALPAESTARVAASHERLARPDATGEVADILRAALFLRDRLGEILGRLDSLQSLAEALGSVAGELSGTLADLAGVTTVASNASAQVEAHAPILASTARAMDCLGGGVDRAIRPLTARLGEVRGKVMELRFLIALAHLHDDMVINFAIEVLDGLAPPDGLSYVPLLCQALSDGVDALAGRLGMAASALRQVAGEVDACSVEFGQFQKLLAAWRIQVPRYGMSRTLGPFVGPIDLRLSRGHEELASFRALAAQCAAEARPFDRSAVQSPIDQISQAARHLLAIPTDPTGPALYGSRRSGPLAEAFARR